MTPSKVLKEYLMDIEDQQRVSDASLNISDSKEIQLIKKAFKSAINLIEFYTKEGIELQNLIKTK